MTPEPQDLTTLDRMIQSGEVRAPEQHGMPELPPELVDDQNSYADLLIVDRERERQR